MWIMWWAFSPCIAAACRFAETSSPAAMAQRGLALAQKNPAASPLWKTGCWTTPSAFTWTTAPFDPAQPNRIAGNLLRFGESGVVFHGPSAGNRFVGNRFSDLHMTVTVEGRGTARDAEWRGNDFDDYAGYDFDGDGIGDVPYVLRTLEADLAARAPALRFFRGTPALALAEWIGRVAPIFQPSTLLEDPAPAMRLAPPPVPETSRCG